MYVDVTPPPPPALDVLRDAKCDYPAACNAVETVLLHESLLTDESEEWSAALADLGSTSDAGTGITKAQAIVTHLQNNGVTLRSGPKLAEKLAQNSGLLGTP